MITAKPVEPGIDRRNSEVFTRTLFSRDDQIFHVLDAGINAGQHEGGGKSLEIRRFGFNLDHGGVSGGLKVLVDDVQQNQGTQGHGQGYLGALKSLTPELVEGVDIINGPFSAQYGDFSGLGVVHIRTRESMPDVWTVRLQGGSFGSERGFFSFSPELKHGDALFAYEGSHTDGPFQSPLRYTRHNLTGSFTQRLNPRRSVGFKYNAGWNDFYSSGQIPLDEVAAGRLDRFGDIDPNNGGRVRSATGSTYFRQEDSHGGVLKVDGFVTRSLFDLFSNFTFFLNDPLHGDGIQQHDSRLIEGVNAQYQLAHKVAGLQALLTAGANFHDNQINVGLYPQEARVPLAVSTRDHAHVTNGATYLQESVTLLGGRMVLGGGLRLDEFRFQVAGRDSITSTLAQPKANVSFRPSISTSGDAVRQLRTRHLYRRRARRRAASRAARGIHHGLLSGGQRAALRTDFDQRRRLLDRPLQRAGLHPRRWNLRVQRAEPGLRSGGQGVRGIDPPPLAQRRPHQGGERVLPRHLPAGLCGQRAALHGQCGPDSGRWHGWSGSLRMRAINHYRLDGEDASIVASGHTVFDLGLSRRIRRGVDFNLTLDNLTNRDYYETQNYFESRLPGQDAMSRIHGTPGYPLTAVVGLTFRLKGK